MRLASHLQMTSPRASLQAFAEAVRVLHAKEDPWAALPELVELLARAIGAEQVASDAWMEAAPALSELRIGAGSWVPVSRSPATSRLGLVWEVFRPVAVGNRIHVALRLGRESWQLTFGRAESFGTDEVDLLELFLAHLTIATGGERMPAAARRANQWALQVPVAGEWAELSPELALLLWRYFPQGADRGLGEVRRWVAEQSRRRTTAPGVAWHVAQPWGCLHLQLVWKPERTAVLRVWEEAGAADYRRLRARGLTLRECEVVFWIAQGKRDAEIATILTASPKTIGKHVEHVLAKLGVESRLAATAAAQVWLAETAE